MHMIGNIFCGYVLGNMLLHKVNCTLYGIRPFHLYHLLLQEQYILLNKNLPDLPCFVLSCFKFFAMLS